jgi:predicted phage tail protein
MKKVYLHGELGKKFGAEWVLNADSLSDILRAIDANKDGFFHHLVKEIDSGAEYVFLKKDLKKIKSNEEFEENCFYKNEYVDASVYCEEIHITRCPEGGVNWIVSSAVAWFKSGGLFKAVLFAGISYGIQMLMKPPEPPKIDSKRVTTKSYILNGATNRTAQGIPVPIGYGRLKIGSINIGVEKQLNELRYSRGDNNQKTLQSYSIYKYLELLCEGPIEGFVDQFGNLVDEENLEKAVFLNDVPIKNTSNQLNFILTESNEKTIEYAKGADDEVKFLSKDSNGNPAGVPYIKNYETLLYGPPPYDNIGSTRVNTYNDSEAEAIFSIMNTTLAIVDGKTVDFNEYKEAQEAFPDQAVDYAMQKGAKIFSHSVTNINVKNISIAFKLELSYNSDTKTLPNTCDFAILVYRNGKDYNIFDKESGCSFDVPAQFTKEGYGIQHGFSTTYMSKAKFGQERWESLTDEEKNARKFKPITAEDWVDKFNNTSDYSVESELVQQSFEIFVDNNGDLSQEYRNKIKNDEFFRVHGLATSPFEFNIDIVINWDFFGEDTVDKTKGIIFKVIKLSHEYDPTLDDDDKKRESGIYNRRNLQLSYIQERVDAVMRYPHSSVVSVMFDSRNFSNVPNRSYHAKLKKILVPSNYNPSTRKYSGAWNGLFKGQRDDLQSLYSITDNQRIWSDNPAWIFFDLITNPRFGLAKYGVRESDIDKWQLYKIAKYCDELVETEYPVETKTGLPRAFSTDNQLKTDLNGEEGYFEIKVEKYFWYNVKQINGQTATPGQEVGVDDEVVYKSKSMEDYFADSNYVPEGISSRDIIINTGNINILFQDMLERDATQSEIDLYVNQEISVGNLISIILNKEDFLKPVFSEVDFIKEFGSGVNFRGKKIAFFLNKHGFFSESQENISKIQEKSSLLEGSYEMEERAIIFSDPSKRTVFVSGPTFEQNSTVLNGFSYGACATQINHPVVEPRFTCNVYISDKSSALDVLNSMSSVFRGIIAYYGGRISPIQDNLKKPIKIFNNSNVSKDGFSYAGGPKNKKFTSSIVKFNNKEKNFKPDVVFEEDVRGIQRLGFLENETIGFGVTSPSQARRLARWNLITPSLESDAIKFTTSVEANMLAPGLVFEVCDEMRMGSNRSGRVLGVEMYREVDGNKIIDPLIIVDRNIANVPVFSRVEISVSIGKSSQSYEVLNNRARDEESEIDQDVEIDNLFSQKITRFDASIAPNVIKGYNQANNFKLTDLLLKIPFEVSLADNRIKSIFHGFVDGDKVRFVSDGVLPSGISKSMVREKAYTVVNTTKHTFQISEYNSQQTVVIKDQGRDSLLNLGGSHYVCPENNDQGFSEKTNEALDQILEGSAYIIKGLTSLPEDSLENIIFTESQLSNLYVNDIGFEPRRGDWVFSELFGYIQITNQDYIYAENLGWIFIGDTINTDLNSEGVWFYVNGFEWVHVLRNDLDYWYFKFFEANASINPWVFIQRDESAGNINKLFIYDADASLKQVDDFVYIGESGYRKMLVTRISSSPSGYWLDFEDSGSSDFIDLSGVTAPEPELSESSQKQNPAFFEAQIINFQVVDRLDSIQDKNCIRVELQPGHEFNILRNLKININGVAHSINGSSFEENINSKFDTIYVSVNMVELLDSESLYEYLNTEGSDFNSYGSANYVEDSNIINQRIQGSKLYRVVSCKEIKSNEFEIVGTEYNPEKFQAIDKNHMTRKPDIPIPPQADMTIPDSPESLFLSDLTFRP